MAWALQLDGVDDYLKTPVIVLSAGDVITFEYTDFVLDTVNNQYIMDAGSYRPWFMINKYGDFQFNTSAMTATIDGAPITNNVTNAPTDGLDHTLEITMTAGANLEYLFCRYNLVEFCQIKIKSITVATKHNWDATASSHGTGQPILTDIIGGNNAQGYNFPTDGSAWVDLGGGETSVDVTTESKTITYTTGQHTVELTGEVNALSDTKTINYSVGQHVASLSGEANVTSDTKTIAYTVGQHLVELSGEINATTDTKVLNYLVGQHSVTLSGDIEAISQTKQIDYTIGQHSVQLSGEVNAQSDTKAINYAIGQHQVEISGDILAATDTANIDYLIGQHTVTLQGDVDALTESKNIVYAVGQHQVFIYSEQPQQLSSYQVSYKPDPYQVAYKTDSFSVQYKD